MVAPLPLNQVLTVPPGFNPPATRPPLATTSPGGSVSAPLPPVSPVLTGAGSSSAFISPQAGNMPSNKPNKNVKFLDSLAQRKKGFLGLFRRIRPEEAHSALQALGQAIISGQATKKDLVRWQKLLPKLWKIAVKTSNCKDLQMAERVLLYESLWYRCLLEPFYEYRDHTYAHDDPKGHRTFLGPIFERVGDDKRQNGASYFFTGEISDFHMDCFPDGGFFGSYSTVTTGPVGCLDVRYYSSKNAAQAAIVVYTTNTDQRNDFSGKRITYFIPDASKITWPSNRRSPEEDLPDLLAALRRASTALINQAFEGFSYSPWGSNFIFCIANPLRTIFTQRSNSHELINDSKRLTARTMMIAAIDAIIEDFKKHLA